MSKADVAPWYYMWTEWDRLGWICGLCDEENITSFTPRSGCVGGSRQGGNCGQRRHVASVRLETEAALGALVRVGRIGSEKLSISTVVALGEGERVGEGGGGGFGSTDPQTPVPQDLREPRGDRGLGCGSCLVAPHVAEGVGPVDMEDMKTQEHKDMRTYENEDIRT